MKIRILDRILVALSGLVILTLCVGVIAQMFFGADVTGWIAGGLETDSFWVKVAVGVGAAALLAMGVYCVLVLFRHRKRKDRFIMQKMESGELAISLKALEKMIAKCLDSHKEVQIESVDTENQRDGLVVSIQGTVASGISIPLTVDALQKQIKQYVTACSGIEVKAIKVLIESSGEEAPDAMFAIDAPAETPLLQEAEGEAEQEAGAEVEPQEETAVETPPKSAAEAAMEAAESMKKEYEDSIQEDERPIHQRLFSTPEEPCIMPLPPENLKEEKSEKQDKPEKPEETEKTEPWEEKQDSEDTGKGDIGSQEGNEA